MEDNICEDPSVGFLYKAMLERDPRKRRVKPVQQHLMQLDFGGLEDSSDDSDYEMPDDVDDVDDEIADDVCELKSRSEGSKSDISGTSSEDEPPEEDSTRPVGFENAVSKLNDAVDCPESNMAASSRIKLMLCCVCLGEISEEENEIVECDSCGISVHEGCYGISDCQSVASTVSSASTEPWFCDACRAGLKPHCELCPNEGGVYKETDTGRWVHIVCALYIPGVAFGDVDKLSPVTLYEMPHTKWGARTCTLCEDERFSQTGVCIGCDAGMCRAYFHVTCGLREGLLSEAAPDEDIADPFYAYCKQHADKLTVRYKRRNWLALQSNIKQSATEHGTLTEKEKARVQRKLRVHRQKYLAGQFKKQPSWVPTEKVPRMLNTSASALRRLLRKAELHGINTQAQNTASNKDIRKKWHIPPAFSVEFVGYYLDRNERMTTMATHFLELVNQRKRLEQQEREIRLRYDQLNQDVHYMRETNTGLRSEAEQLWKVITAVSAKPLNLPDVLKPRKVTRTPAKDTSKETPKSPPAVIHQCGLCQKTSNQHLLAKCDTCKLRYHLGCLDPPLTRMPKKTKLFGWQCSECASSGSDVSGDDSVDPNAPRRLRDKIKEPVKWMPLLICKSRGRVKGHSHKKRPRASVKKPLALKRSASSEPEARVPALKKEKSMTPPTKRRSPKRHVTRPDKSYDTRTECASCMKTGDNNNLVRCDNCQLCYHFGCLNPPRRTTPKQRGYGWLCSACTTSSSEEELTTQRPRSADKKPREADETGIPASTVEYGHQTLRQ